MRKKGGISMVIETVLLLGFIVASMMVVYFWAKSKSEAEIETTIEGMASSLQCADIRLVYSCDDDDGNFNAVINNTGLFNVNKTLVRDITTNNKFDPIKVDLPPKGSFILSSFIPYNADYVYEVTPLIEANRKLYMCKEKGISVICK